MSNRTIGLFVSMLVVCGCNRPTDNASNSTILQGATKSKCPEKTEDPEKREGPNGGVDPASQHGTITEAIKALKTLGTTTNDPKLNNGKLTELAECLEKMHKDGRICVTKAEKPGYGGKCTPDFKGGWGGDIIIVNRTIVNNAGSGAAGVAGGNPPTDAFNILKAVLAHEAVHATDDAPKSEYYDDPDGAISKENQRQEQEKKQEKESTETEIAVLEACAGGVDLDKRKCYLEKWLKNLCEWAKIKPDMMPTRSCVNVRRHNVRPAQGLVGFVDYAFPGGGKEVEESDPEANHQNVVQVMVLSGASHDVFTDVVYPTVMFLTEDEPSAGEETLVVIGLNADETATQVQRMVFLEDGTFVSRDAVVTYTDRRIMAGAPVEGAAVGYVYDEQNEELLVLEDNDADGVPESLGPVFATAAAFSDLLEIGSMEATAEGTIVVYSTSPGSVVSLGTTVTTIIDADADGVADSSTTGRVKDTYVFGPLFTDTLRDGDLSLVVRGTANSQVEVWRVDATGAPLSLLGSGVIDYDTNELEVTLGDPLTEGDLIMIRDLTQNREPPPSEVEEDVS